MKTEIREQSEVRQISKKELAEVLGGIDTVPLPERPRSIFYRPELRPSFPYPVWR